MEIYELEGKRFEIALQLLQEGEYILYENIGIKLIDNKQVNFIIPSSCWQLENITKNNALDDLENAKTKIKNMLSNSKELSDLLSNKEFVYLLNYDTGKAGIEICEERNEKIKWLINL